MIPTIDIKKLVSIAQEAGDVIMDIYAKDFKVEYKEDQSPLTDADTAAHNLISQKLTEYWPEIPILSEEGKTLPYSQRNTWQSLWIVDPIDGTKEFIKKNGEFTVNIALAHEGHVIAGVVYAPALNSMYWGQLNQGAYRETHGTIEELQVNSPFDTPQEGKDLRVVASRSHRSPELDDYLSQLSIKEVVSKGSSLKICQIAEGSADLYPRIGLTMEWDTAAAHAVVKAAGGNLYHVGTHQELNYNREDLLNPYFEVY